MKIVITGGRGQLGRDCRRVLGAGHTVHAFGSGDLDITDEQQVGNVVRRLQPDIVINCAAYTAVDACEDDRQRCRLVNGEGPGILAAATAAAGCKLIHVSTDYVFDGRKPLSAAYTEDDPVAPLSAYGASKLAGEEAVRQNSDNHLIIRTAWLYGMGGRNFLKTMLRLAVSEPRRTIRVVNDQFGSLTWTYRLALQIRLLLDSDLTGTVHATAEGYGSWFDGAGRFLRAMGVEHSLEPCATADYPTAAPRPANSILENRRLEKHCLNGMVSWEDDVERFAREFRDPLLAEARQ